MFGFLGKFFRHKKSEFEAHLRPVADCAYGGIGEIEIETWSDGSMSLEASLKHSSVPDTASLEVYCSGQHVTSLVTSGGYSKQYLDSTTVEGLLPQVKTGDDAEFRHRGGVLYKGRFKRD